MKHGHWQWGDSGCLTRVAPEGQGDSKRLLLAWWDRERRGWDGLHRQLWPCLCSPGLWQKPRPSAQEQPSTGSPTPAALLQPICIQIALSKESCHGQ